LGVSAEAGVVAGGDGVAPELVGAAQQRVPLDVRVAEHARVGRASGEVLRRERVLDVRAERVAQVEHEVREAEAQRHGAGVVHVVERAAAHLLARLGAGGLVVGPRLHRDADDLVPFLVQQHRRHRRIDAAGHRHERATVLGHGEVDVRLRFEGRTVGRPGRFPFTKA